MIVIHKNGMFTTPKDYAQIESWIGLHLAEDRMSLHTVMHMTINYLADQAEKARRTEGERVAIRLREHGVPELDIQSLLAEIGCPNTLEEMTSNADNKS